MIHLYRIVLIKTLVMILFMFSTPDMRAQNIITEMDHDARHMYDRMMILGGAPPVMHSSVFPYLRSDLIELAGLFESASARCSHARPESE